MFYNFSLKLNISALWARKLKNTLNKRKTKFALTCNVQKVIRRSHLEVVKNSKIRFFSKLLVQSDSQSYEL